MTDLQAKTRWSTARRYYELLSVLVERNLKGRYRGSFLGVYWSLLNPLIMTALYTAIFGTVFASYFDNSIVNYVLAAFTGLVVINFFNASTNQALPSIVGNGSILNKIRLPVSIFPVSMVVANIFQFAISIFPLLAIVTLWKSQSLINVIALIFPVIGLSLVCTGVGFFVSTLYVFFRDLPYFYEIVCFVAWISSPIFYPPWFDFSISTWGDYHLRNWLDLLPTLATFIYGFIINDRSNSTRSSVSRKTYSRRILL